MRTTGAAGPRRAKGRGQSEDRRTVPRSAQRPGATVEGRAGFEAALAARLATGAGGALCQFDLDQFGLINLAAGGAAGDRVLADVNALWSGALHPGELFGHSSDDEFLLFVPGADFAAARDRARAFQQLLADYRPDFENPVPVFTVRVGISVGGPDAPVAEVMRRAQAACWVGRDTRRGRIVSGDDPETEDAMRAARVLSELHAAIEENRLQLFAQEILSFRPELAAQFQLELMVHMIDREGVKHLPSALIPAAERYGFIRDLDRWVMRAALVDNAAILHDNPDLCLSLNLSGASLGDPDLWPYIAGLFAASGIAGSRVQFEITETSPIHDMASARAFVDSARAHGCKVALDDFGSGLSTFAYLKQFPVDCLKIDGTIIAEFANPESKDRAIVKSIVGLAHELGMTVVAEHVDSHELLAALRHAGVDSVQGYLLSQPLPFRELFDKSQEPPPPEE